MGRTLLVDVRTPEEYATGFLGSAINIEYQDIAQLADRASKTDQVTLYCRSGRRSGIALETLKSLGFAHVRDIGGLEEAREALRREELQNSNIPRKKSPSKSSLDSSFNKLLEGLNAQDGEK
jgi:rhodanese-related sulfurtransferase